MVREVTPEFIFELRPSNQDNNAGNQVFYCFKF